MALLVLIAELLIVVALSLWPAGYGEPGSTQMAEPHSPAAYPAPTPAVAPIPAFGDGVHAVGRSGIAPGTYRSVDQQGECYWARLSGFSGGDDVIATDRISEYNAVATILPTDAGFLSRVCAPWLAVALPDVGENYTYYTGKVGDGLHIVGHDIAPGTYRATNRQGSCRWKRLASFAWPDDVIDSGTATKGDEAVTILVADAGFESSGCGEWISQGFDSCEAMQAAFPFDDGVSRSHPVYKPELDDDGDGIACETEN